MRAVKQGTLTAAGLREQANRGRWLRTTFGSLTQSATNFNRTYLSLPLKDLKRSCTPAPLH